MIYLARHFGATDVVNPKEIKDPVGNEKKILLIFC